MLYDERRWTRPVHLTLAAARDQAAAIGSDEVGTEHLLRAMLTDPAPGLNQVLGSLGMQAAELTQRLDRLATPGGQALEPRSRSRALHAVLASSERAAYDLGQGYVASEHLLLGLLSHPETVAGLVLQEAGVLPEPTRAACARLVGV
jgi:ATP-dependent Clp protease ATP-binding subunit ClpC